ncbi:MAG: 6-pyruvoyl-tetrahydropterin synthase-related protein [Aggregatilineales bacterium]
MERAPAIPFEDLPRWMRQAQRGWDWGLLLALALSLFAAWPFLIQPGLPQAGASENYAFLAADYAAALQEGRLYPRWSAYAQQGYGAPIPHYYPPGPPYAAALIEVLFTNSAVAAVRALYAGAFCLAGAGTYGLVSRHAGARAGLVAAALLVFSPYLGHTAPHILGDLPTVIGIALLAALLWRVDRLLARAAAHDLALVALGTWALLLTHPPLTAVGLSLAAALALREQAAQRSQVPWTLLGSSIALGLAMAAFYWLPALAERDIVTWHTSGQSVTPRASLKELFQPIPPVDVAELAPAPRFSLGQLAVTAAVVGTALGFLTRHAASFFALFFAAGCVLAALGTLAFPTQTWLIGGAALCAAAAGGGTALLAELLPQGTQRLFAPVLLAALFAASAPVWLVARWSASDQDLTPTAQILYEQQNASSAVLPRGAPLPSTLSPTLTSRTPADILNRVVRASGLQASVIQNGTHTVRLQVSTDTPQRLDLLMAYFPGWQAWSGATPLPLFADPATNLMQLQVPAMNGEVVLTLGPTPPRQYGWLISLSALAILAGLAWFRARCAQADYADYKESALLPVEETRLLAVSTTAFALILLAFAAPFSPLTLHARPGYKLDSATALRDRTDAGLEAIAFRLDQPTYRPGDQIELTLYWRALRFLTENYQVRVSLQDVTRGTLRYQTTPHYPGGFPTRRWQPYQYVADTYVIRLDPDLPPDDYQIIVEVFACKPVCDLASRLSFFDSAGNPRGQALNLPVFARVVGAPRL